jgi:hypothetical protein
LPLGSVYSRALPAMGSSRSARKSENMDIAASCYLLLDTPFETTL